MMKTLKNTLALLLAVVLCLSMLGVGAFADEETTECICTVHCSGGENADCPACVNGGWMSACKGAFCTCTVKCEGSGDAFCALCASDYSQCTAWQTAEELREEARTYLSYTIATAQDKLAETDTYTAESLAALEAAIAEAQAVYNDDTRTVEEYETANSALYDVMYSLERITDSAMDQADRNTLEGYIDRIAHMDTTSLSADTKAQVEAAVATAQAMVDAFDNGTSTYTYADYQEAAAALEAALSAIANDSGDSGDAEADDTKAGGTTIGDGTTTDGTTTDGTTTDGTTTDDAALTEEETALQNAQSRLQEAIENQAYATNSAALYTASSFASLQAAIDAAQALLSDTTATEQQLEAAAAAIVAAGDALEREPTSAAQWYELKELENVINVCEIMLAEEDSYTEESLAKLQVIYERAKVVQAKENPTYEEVMYAVESGQLVFNYGLEHVDGYVSMLGKDWRSTLENYVKEMKHDGYQYDSTRYTAESIAQLKEELAAAEELLAKEDLTEEEAKAAYVALRNILVYRDDYALTDGVVGSTELKSMLKYGQFLLDNEQLTEKDAASLKAAMAAAEELAAKDSITYGEYQPVYEALSAQLKALALGSTAEATDGGGTSDSDRNGTSDSNGTADSNGTGEGSGIGEGGGTAENSSVTSGGGAQPGGDTSGRTPPTTGDETNITLYVVLALVSVTGLAVLTMRRRKEER